MSIAGKIRRGYGCKDVSSKDNAKVAKPVEKTAQSKCKESPLSGSRLEEFFLILHRCNGVIAAACQAHGIGVSAVYNKKDKEPLFKKRLENTITAIKESIEEFRDEAANMVDDKIRLAIANLPLEQMTWKEAVTYRKLEAEIKGEIGRNAKDELTDDIPDSDRPDWLIEEKSDATG